MREQRSRAKSSGMYADKEHPLTPHDHRDRHSWAQGKQHRPRAHAHPRDSKRLESSGMYGLEPLYPSNAHQGPPAHDPFIPSHTHPSNGMSYQNDHPNNGIPSTHGHTDRYSRQTHTTNRSVPDDPMLRPPLSSHGQQRYMHWPGTTANPSASHTNYGYLQNNNNQKHAMNESPTDQQRSPAGGRSPITAFELPPEHRHKKGTVTCRHWRRGRCDLQENCNFAHHEHAPQPGFRGSKNASISREGGHRGGPPPTHHSGYDTNPSPHDRSQGYHRPNPHPSHAPGQATSHHPDPKSHPQMIPPGRLSGGHPNNMNQGSYDSHGQRGMRYDNLPPFERISVPWMGRHNPHPMGTGLFLPPNERTNSIPLGSMPSRVDSPIQSPYLDPTVPPLIGEGADPSMFYELGDHEWGELMKNVPERKSAEPSIHPSGVAPLSMMNEENTMPMRGTERSLLSEYDPVHNTPFHDVVDPLRPTDPLAWLNAPNSARRSVPTHDQTHEPFRGSIPLQDVFPSTPAVLPAHSDEPIDRERIVTGPMVVTSTARMTRGSSLNSGGIKSCTVLADDRSNGGHIGSKVIQTRNGSNTD